MENICRICGKAILVTDKVDRISICEDNTFFSSSESIDVHHECHLENSHFTSVADFIEIAGALYFTTEARAVYQRIAYKEQVHYLFNKEEYQTLNKFSHILT